MISRRSLLSLLPFTALPKPKPKASSPMVWSNQQSDQLIFPPGAITGKRIVIDQNGIVIYDANNHPIFVAAPDGTVPANDLASHPFIFGGAQSGFASLQVKTATPHDLFEFFADPYYQVQFLTDNSVTHIGGPLGAITYEAVPFVVGKPNKWVFGGTGVEGAYYYEEWGFTGVQTFTTGVQSTLGNTGTGQWSLNQTLSDYGNMMGVSGFQWTCPDDGIYTIHLNLNFTAVYGAAGLIRCIVVDETLANKTIAMDERSVILNAQAIPSPTWQLFINKSDILHFDVLQTSGANKTINNTSGFAKLAIRRVL
jgi:hypothetical protein